MAVNGKQKGNGFERKVAKILSERFATYLGVATGFYRNRDSGSYFGGTNVQRTQTHNLEYAVFGDLVCPRNFLYGIECKFYKTPPSFRSIVEPQVTQWDDWLAQAEQDSSSAGKKMALVIKYNNTPEIVFLKQAITDTPSILSYQAYYLYTLGTFLAQPDTEFFGSKDTQSSSQ